MTNNVLNNTCPNDFTVTTATSGATRTLTTSNTVANAASQAFEVISVAGTSAGDPYTRWSVGTTTQYALGIDNSDSDYFKLTTAASGTTPSTATVIMKIGTTGTVQLPLTTQFYVIKDSSSTDVTGDGTYYKVALNSEKFDIQSAFDPSTNFYFTAPVAGKYFFSGIIRLLQIGSSHNIALSRIRINGATDSCIYTVEPDEAESGSSNLTMPVIDFISLAANDTVELGISVGGSTKVVDVAGNAFTWMTYMQGILFG